MGGLIEHPEITMIERTGYPSYAQPESFYCEECGDDITDDDKYEDENHEYLCQRCLLYLHKKEW